MATQQPNPQKIETLAEFLVERANKPMFRTMLEEHFSERKQLDKASKNFLSIWDTQGLATALVKSNKDLALQKKIMTYFIERYEMIALKSQTAFNLMPYGSSARASLTAEMANHRQNPQPFFSNLIEQLTPQLSAPARSSPSKLIDFHNDLGNDDGIDLSKDSVAPRTGSLARYLASSNEPQTKDDTLEGARARAHALGSYYKPFWKENSPRVAQKDNSQPAQIQEPETHHTPRVVKSGQ